MSLICARKGAEIIAGRMESRAHDLNATLAYYQAGAEELRGFGRVIRCNASTAATGERKDKQEILRSFEAVLMKLPALVRGRVGGFTKLDSLEKDQAWVRSLIECVTKAEQEMEKFLSSEFPSKPPTLTGVEQPAGAGNDNIQEGASAAFKPEIAMLTESEGKSLGEGSDAVGRILKIEGEARLVRNLLLGMAGLCLVLAFVRFHAIWPYQLSRWGLCAGAGWAAYRTAGWRRAGLVVLAVIYNPLQPITFDALWPWVNGLSAACFIALTPFPARVRRWEKWPWIWGDVKTAGKGFLWAAVGTVVVVSAGAVGTVVVVSAGLAIKRHYDVKKEAAQREEALIAPPLEFWRKNFRIREFEAALDGADAALREIGAMEKEGVLTNRAAAEAREKWTWIDDGRFYRSVHETREQRAKREWETTMALAFVVEILLKGAERPNLNKSDFVKALYWTCAEKGRDWRDGKNWPDRATMKDYWPDIDASNKWEDGFYSAIAAEFCAALRQSKDSRDKLFTKFCEGWEGLARSEKIKGRELPWSLEMVSDFVKAPEKSNWINERGAVGM